MPETLIQSNQRKYLNNSLIKRSNFISSIIEQPRIFVLPLQLKCVCFIVYCQVRISFLHSFIHQLLTINTSTFLNIFLNLFDSFECLLIVNHCHGHIITVWWIQSLKNWIHLHRKLVWPFILSGRFRWIQTLSYNLTVRVCVYVTLIYNFFPLR